MCVVVHTKYKSSLRHHYHVHDCWREALDGRRENGVSIKNALRVRSKSKGSLSCYFEFEKPSDSLYVAPASLVCESGTISSPSPR